jgi:hypothetical protein
MIDVSDPGSYQSAIAHLKEFKRFSGGRGYKGRFVQVFLGLKFYQDEIPSIYSGTFVSTEILQSFLDDLYAKSSKPLNECVLSLFEANHLARTGVIPAGRAAASNIWRNNLNLQKGIGCYAPTAELASRSFLNQPRSECRHLVGEIEGGRCNLCPTTARYRGESHRKWLRIDSGGGGYAVVDLMNIENFSSYTAPNGNRIPVVPLIIALYHDGNPGLTIGSRRTVSVADFALDFHFSHQELLAYFALDPENDFNSAFLVANPNIEYAPQIRNRADKVIDAASNTQTQRIREPSIDFSESEIPTPILTGTVTPPPQTHAGWHAEQFVYAALQEAGWDVHDVRRQRVGFDLLAKKARHTFYVEVKSSVNLCSPTFTAREWQQARNFGSNYILAVIENFDPNGDNMIYWIQDPAGNCNFTRLHTVSYSIPRSSWTLVVGNLDRLT